MLTALLQRWLLILLLSFMLILVVVPGSSLRRMWRGHRMAFSLAVSLSLLLTMRTDGLRSFLGLLNKLCSTSAAWRIVAVV